MMKILSVRVRVDGFEYNLDRDALREMYHTWKNEGVPLKNTLDFLMYLNCEKEIVEIKTNKRPIKDFVLFLGEVLSNS